MKELKEYLDDYINILADKSFKIELENGDLFYISFKTYNFPHLLGLSYCTEGKKTKEYVGSKAISNICSGVLTCEHLKQINNKAFQKYVVCKSESFEKMLELFAGNKH